MAEEMLAGYRLIEEKSGAVIDQWGGVWGRPAQVPASITLPSGDQVCAPQPGESYQGHVLTEWYVEKPLANTSDVDTERDLRISSGFVFQNKLFQFRESDRENINGAGTLAALAIMGGAQPKDYRWHGGDQDFVWITADNTLMALDAFDTVNLGKAAAAWKSAHIFAARNLKDQSPLPEDYQNAKYWPTKAELE